MRKLQLSFALWAVLVSAGIISFCAELPAGLKQRHGCCFIFLNQNHFNLLSHSIIFFFFLFSVLLSFHHCPCRAAEGREAVLPSLPISHRLSVTSWAFSLCTGTCCSVPLAPLSPSRRKMNSPGSQVQFHSIDQLTKRAAAEHNLNPPSEVWA